MDDHTPPSGDESTTPESTATRRRKDRHRAVPLSREVRYFAPTQVEVRSEQGSPDITITGAAIVYGTAYRVVDMFGEFRETIHAGSVSDLLTRQVDCRFLFNHDGLPMARTTSGTLTLADDSEALRFVARLDARQQLANDFAIAVERGDLSQMSIGMIVDNDKWAEDAEGETRDIFGLADLLDISGVTYPCSPTTHIEVAQRMALAMPLGDSVRLRNIEVDLRSGKAMSASNQAKFVAGLSAFHALAKAVGVDPSALGPDDDEDAPDGHQDGSDDAMGNAESDAGVVFADGSGARDVADEAEHRDEEAATEDASEAVEAPESSTMKASTLRLMVEAGRHGNVAD